ncbi:MAG: hypothetical protein IJJ52_04455 [Lachnospiraceae bacterium]|nr:hypothetical protein [Lachnospiraceae bacterium]
MIALGILDIKKFMSAFLIGPLFDDYTMVEAQITTFCTISIDGRYLRSFYEERSAAPGTDTAVSAEGDVEYIAWKQIKERCFDMIKGRRTPLFFKFVFFFPKNQIPRLFQTYGVSVSPETISGLCLNLRYDGNNLVLTTGSSMKVFSMDRSADHAWDEYVRDLMIQNSILTENL